MIEFDLKEENNANIKIIGVGGGGGNAINRMIDDELTGVEFVAINTDKQALMASKANVKLQIGEKTTKGLGAGSNPNIGSKAAYESQEDIKRILNGVDMAFISAGMGGGTGTGAAPHIGKIAKELGVLTIGVVTMPFSFEGSVRARQANLGIESLRKYVDTLIIIKNDKLMQAGYGEFVINDAFNIVDSILKKGVQSISDLIIRPGLVNLDFADIRTIMLDKGLAHMGIGSAKGEGKALKAAKQSIKSPLLDTEITGAKSLLFNITGGYDLTMQDINEASTYITDKTHEDANVIFGSVIDEKLKDEIRITVVATELEKNTDENKTKNSSNDEKSSEKKSSEKEDKEDNSNDFKIPDFLNKRRDF